jgi:beta-lactamase regulating signal transducer with metallopeptidase domain
MIALQIALARVFELSVSAAAVAAIVLLFRRFFRKWVSPAWLLWLWLIVLVKLVVPVSLPGLTGIENWSDRFAYQQRYSVGWLMDTAAGYWERLPWQVLRHSEEASPLAGYERGLETQWDGFTLDEETMATRRKGNAINGVQLAAVTIWLTGSLVGAVAGWRAAWRTRRLIYRALPCRDSAALDILEQCKAEAGISAPVQLLLGGTVFPFFYGLFKPRIMLPHDYGKLYNGAELRLILLHELQHWRMKDNLLQLAASLLRIPHWFNPLVHLAVERLRDDLELRCDKRVTCRLNTADKVAYGQLLLKQGELNLRLPGARRMGAVTPWLESRSTLTERIRALAASLCETKAARRSRLAAGILAFFIGLGVLPGGSDLSRQIASASPEPSMYAIWLDESVNPRSMGAINEISTLIAGLDGTDSRIELLLNQPLQRNVPEHWFASAKMLLMDEDVPVMVDTRPIREEIRRREIGRGRILIFLHFPYYNGRSVGISVAKQSLSDLSTLQQLEQITLY